MSIRDRNQDVDANILKLIRRLREESKDHDAKIIRLLYYLWFWPVCEDFLHVWSQKRIRKWFNFQHALKLCTKWNFESMFFLRKRHGSLLEIDRVSWKMSAVATIQYNLCRKWVWTCNDFFLKKYIKFEFLDLIYL